MIMPMTAESLVLIVDDDEPLDAAVGSARAALDRWPGGTLPPLRALRCSDVIADDQDLPQTGVVWVRVRHAKPASVYELLDLIQGRYLSVVIDEAVLEHVPIGCDEGVFCLPRSSDAAARGLVMQSLWSQAPIFASLRSENRLLAVSQGGLEREVSRVDEEMRLAAQLQQEFLPERFPEIRGVSFGALWLPASYVSGDIYDVQRLDEHHVGIFIADAVGHGVAAALLSMYIKRALVTKRIDPQARGGYRLVEPAEALAAINADLIAHQSNQVRFATAMYALLDTRSRRLRIARAGHPPARVVRSGRPTLPLEPDGALLGVFQGETFTQEDIRLDRGDRLVLHTDGFEMAFAGAGAGRDAGKRAATEDYKPLLDELFREDTPQAGVESLRQQLAESAGSLNQRDDLTLVCVGLD